VKDLIEQLSRNAKILPARKKGNCRIWFMYSGKPVFITAGTKKPKEAKDRLSSNLEKWLLGRPKETAPIAPKSLHPWEQESARFIAIQHKHSSPAYKRDVASVLRDFGKAAGMPDVCDMTKIKFREIWSSLEVGKAAHTQANWLGILGGFARWLMDEDIINFDFTRGVKRPSKRSFGKREAIYQESDFLPIWEELPLWARPLWEDHWYTGMDTKDIWQFKPKKHLLKIGSNWKIWKPRAKQAETIDQPINSKIKERWIKQWEESGPDDFMYPELHKRFSDEKSMGNMLRKSVYAAQDRRGLPRLDIKTTRHTFATRHVLRLVKGEKNAPSIDQIRLWMGHAKDSRVLERIYLKLLSRPELMD
jgi:integrase